MGPGSWEKPRDMPKPKRTDFVPNAFQARVAERLEALGINAFDAADRGSFPDRKFVYDITTGRKGGVRGANLRALAAALECSPEYLLGETDEISRTIVGEIASKVWVRGKVAAGMWIDVSIEQDGKFERMESPFPVDPRYPAEAQFDLIVQGTSVDRFARDGQRLRCISPDGSGRDWQEGDLVVAVRFRGELRERTVKRAKRRNGHWALMPESDDPIWEPLELHEHRDGDDMERVEIEGIVLYVYAVA